MLFTTLVPYPLTSGYILSYFFKLLRVLSLSRMLNEFSLTCTFHHVWENFFSLWCWKCIETLHFYSCTSPPLKTPGRIFLKMCFPQNEKGGWRKLWFALLKFGQKKWRRLFIFCMIYNFSKCDGFTVLWIISIK